VFKDGDLYSTALLLIEALADKMERESFLFIGSATYNPLLTVVQGLSWDKKIIGPKKL